MSDETKRLKEEEQANWEWEYDVEESDVLKADEKSGGRSAETDYSPFMKLAGGALFFSVLFLLMSASGVNFAAFGRYAWLIFLLPFFFGSRRPNWMALTFLFLVVTGLFSGTFFGMWWLIFLVPMFMSKESRSC